MAVVLGQEITVVPRELWDRSQPAGKADWQNLAWQRMTAAQRYAEWARHMGATRPGDGGLRRRSSARRWLRSDRNRLLPRRCGQGRPRPDGRPLRTVERLLRRANRSRHLASREIPFDTDSFDSVFCINCLDHTQDADSVIEEIARVLRPSGRLVFHVDLDSPLRTLHKRVKKNCRDLHPLSLRYDWLRGALEPSFEIEREHRDRNPSAPPRRTCATRRTGTVSSTG